MIASQGDEAPHSVGTCVVTAPETVHGGCELDSRNNVVLKANSKPVDTDRVMASRTSGSVSQMYIEYTN